jgi:hypothetical protein
MNQETQKQIVLMIEQITHLLTEVNTEHPQSDLANATVHWIQHSQKLIETMDASVQSSILLSDSLGDNATSRQQIETNSEQIVIDKIRQLLDTAHTNETIHVRTPLQRVPSSRTLSAIPTRLPTSRTFERDASSQKMETQRLRISLTDSWSTIPPQRLGIEYDHLGERHRGVHNFIELYRDVANSFLINNSVVFYHAVDQINKHGKFVSYKPEEFAHHIQIGKIYLNVDIAHDQIRENILVFYASYKLDTKLFGLWVLNRSASR